MSETKSNYLKLKNTFLKYEKELSGLTQELHNKKPNENSWSMLETIFHISEAEVFSVQYIQKKSLDVSKLKQTNLNTSYRFFLLMLALKLPVKYKVPKVISNPQGPFDTEQLLDKWRKNHSELESFIKHRAKELDGLEVFKHPRAGMLNLNQMLKFMILHAERHLKQIKRIKKEITRK